MTTEWAECDDDPRGGLPPLLDSTPICPHCGGRSTSYCALVRRRRTFLCSPCCEVFYEEDSPPAPPHRPLAAYEGWLPFLVALALAAYAAGYLVYYLLGLAG